MYHVDVHLLMEQTSYIYRYFLVINPTLSVSLHQFWLLGSHEFAPLLAKLCAALILIIFATVLTVHGFQNEASSR